jgi:hypothetical protein
MPKFVTPARLVAALGVVTGLSAAATSLLDVLPKESSASRLVLGGVGVLGTIATLIKFLDGQAGWEQLQAKQAHEVMQIERDRTYYASLPQTTPELTQPEPLEPAVLEDEVPIDVAAEPQRLYDQLPAEAS